MQIVRLIDQNYMQSKYATYTHLLVSEVLLVIVVCNFAFNIVSCLEVCSLLKSTYEKSIRSTGNPQFGLAIAGITKARQSY
jgi:hypothetical protein